MHVTRYTLNTFLPVFRTWLMIWRGMWIAFSFANGSRRCLTNLQIMAESTQKLSDDLKHTRPDIPWSSIAGFRHRLVHDYFQIDLNLVRRVLVEHLPSLALAVREMINR